MWVTIAAGIGTIATAIVAIISLVYIAKQARAVREQVEQIREQAQGMREQTEVVREQAKTNRAYEYIRRFNDPTMRIVKAEAVGFLKNTSISEERKWAVLLGGEGNPNNIDLQSKVMLILNFFEELAIMYNRNLVHREIIESFFRKISLRYYEYATRYVSERRVRMNHPMLYGEWQEMNINLRKT